MLQAIIPNAIQTLIKNRESILWKVIFAVGIFFVIYFISKFVIERVRRKIENNSLQNDVYTNKVSALVGNIIFIFLMIFDVLVVFQVIGFNTAIIMGGISLSVWLAMETIIENMVAGIMFITIKKIKIGDYVEFLWNLNMKWTIEEINVRYSVIRSFDHRAFIIPNSILAKTPIKTYKQEPILRGDLSINVPRHVNIAQIQKLINQTINMNKYVVQKEYTTTFITGFNNMGIGMKTYFFTNPPKKTPVVVTRDLRIAVMKMLKKYGIKKPYPHVTLTTN
jgi:small conductance mechanosensitive channel